MKYFDYIESGINAAGGPKALATRLHMHDTSLHAARKGSRRLSDEQCARLAQVLEIDWNLITAARNEALADTPEEAEFWRPFAHEQKAASWIAAIASAAIIGTGALPSDSQAATGFSRLAGPANVYYVNYRLTLRRLRQIAAAYLKTLLTSPLFTAHAA